MSTPIAELFVALGVQGTEKTISALASTRMNISSIASTSLEAKAAILGMAYALERLTIGSSTNAANLKNSSSFIGMNTTELQKWIYTAEQANVSAQEMQASIGAIYKNIENYSVTHKLPDSSAKFAEETGLDLTKPFDVQEILKRSIKLTQSKRLTHDQINSILEGWGLGQNLIGSIWNGQFKLSNFQNAPVLSGKEINSLSNMRSEFTQLENKVKLFFGHFTAEHSTEIIKMLKDMTDAFLSLATVLDEIATKLHLFEIIDKAFRGLKEVAGFGKDVIEGKRNEKNFFSRNLLPSKEETIELYKNIQNDIKFSKSLNNLPSLGQGIEDFIYTSKMNLNKGYGEFAKDIPNLLNRNGYDILKSSAVPSLPSRYGLTPQTNNINVTQNMTFDHDGTDFTDIQNMHQNALERAIAETVSMLPRGRVT